MKHHVQGRAVPLGCFVIGKRLTLYVPRGRQRGEGVGTGSGEKLASLSNDSGIAREVWRARQIRHGSLHQVSGQSKHEFFWSSCTRVGVKVVGMELALHAGAELRGDENQVLGM